LKEETGRLRETFGRGRKIRKLVGRYVEVDKGNREEEDTASYWMEDFSQCGVIYFHSTVQNIAKNTNLLTELQNHVATNITFD
jgi:hypothetical protein